MTAPSITGSISQYVDTTSNPFSDDITVPADATLCLAGVIGWYDTQVNFSTATLGGTALTQVRAFVGGTSGSSVALWQLVSPPTGSRAFARQLNVYPYEGAHIFVVFLKDINTSAPITDSDEGDSGTASTATSGSFTSTANDLCLCVGYSYSSTDGDAAPTGAGQTEVADSALSNGCQGAVGTKPGVAGATTMKFAGDYPTLIACSIAGTAVSGSQIKVLAGVAQASVKVAASVAAASIKKVAGVANA
jgi:hypothetical protein